MGFLKIFGKALDFYESEKYFKIIKDSFVKYVIHAFKEIKTKNYNIPLFGYEIELHSIHIDHTNKKVYLDLTAQEKIQRLSKTHLRLGYDISQEFGGWMIEATHGTPFEYKKIYLLYDSVKNLYQYLRDKFGNENILFISTYPRLGVGEYFLEGISDEEDEKIEDSTNKNCQKNLNEEEKNSEIKKIENKNIINEEKNIPKKTLEEENTISKSLFFSDKCINKHPRFGCLARNIRERRGEKVEIKIPIYKDQNTNLNITKEEPFADQIYMDAMGFGMGNCSMQITLGSCCLSKAVNNYDQLIPFTPLFLALSSCSPIFKGKLANFDNRFLSICESVDDRTKEERNPNSEKYIYKSRYSPAYSYIGESKFCKDFYNDYPKFPINKDYYEELVKNDISPKLATHFCNLLVRDPLVIFSEKIKITDEHDMSHFENLNTTNWNSLRFKLPRPSDGDSCFKIEVRSPELQITPFENSSLMEFILLVYLSNCYNSGNINYIIPITMVDENFNRAYKINSVTEQKYYWRIKHEGVDYENLNLEDDIKNNIKELTIYEILTGKKEYGYKGVFDDIIKFIDTNYNGCCVLKNVLKYIELRSKGEIWTDAKYIRNFVLNHKAYKKDSIVTDEINYDLVCHLLEIQNEKIKPKELYGEFANVIDTLSDKLNGIIKQHKCSGKFN